VLHRRTFELDRRTARLRVCDELLGAGERALESLLHLAPGTTVTATSDGAFLLSNRGAHMQVAFWGMAAVELAEDWVSTEFGARERAPLFVARPSGALPAHFGWAFAPVPWNARARLEDKEDEVARA